MTTLFSDFQDKPLSPIWRLSPAVSHRRDSRSAPHKAACAATCGTVAMCSTATHAVVELV